VQGFEDSIWETSAFQIMQTHDSQPRTRVIFGEGAFERLGELARELGFHQALLVTDEGLIAASHATRAMTLLRAAGVEACTFHEFSVNPDTDAVARGRDFAAALRVDSIVALGGGSSLDCAKGINFLLTNGGRMRDYRGYGKASKPMLPMLAVPTTAGTGSEAQSYAVLSDAQSKVKMACGDPKAAFRIALLDPALVVTAPRGVRAAAGFDAIAHAVETWVTTKRNDVSRKLSLEAWEMLSANFLPSLEHPTDVKIAGDMLQGAHLAGAAIENSMLGATHACANPLTARFSVMHGDALAVLLPHVVRWNAVQCADQYAKLTFLGAVVSAAEAAEELARWLYDVGSQAGLPRNLRDLGVPREAIPQLAEDAAEQWTGTFNPRPFDAAGACEIYEAAW
jgi:alcohol dehydrogenase